MRSRLVRRLSLVVVALAPAAAMAFGGGARAGLLYTRLDARPHDAPATTSPHLDVDLALDARGVIVSEHVVRYNLGVGWGRASDDVPGGGQTTRLSYSGNASILQNQSSPIGLSVFASRGETDFATNGNPDAFGSGLASAAGGSAYFKAEGLPTLDAYYTWTESQNRIAGQPLRVTSAQVVGSSLHMSAPTLSVVARYKGEFRDGSWEFDRLQRHDAAINTRATVGRQTISFNGMSALSLPAELVPGTVKQQTTSFESALDANSEWRRSYRYTYGEALVESPGFPTRELERQSLRYEGDHFLTRKHLFTRWFLDATYASTRVDAAEEITTGETLGATLFWRRAGKTTALDVNAGPRVSLLQTDAGDGGGFGASAGARVGRPLGVHALQLDWAASYGQALFATAGWTVHQSLGATLSGPAATARYNAGLRATAFRAHNPIAGDGAGRNLAASASIATPRVRLHGRANFSSGMVGSTPAEFTGDGLLLPAPFNSTEIDVAIGAQAKLFPGLSAKLDVRLGRSDIPNRPVLHEAAAIAGMTYTYEKIGMGVENRLSRVETAGGWNTTNQVMFRVYRSFGW